MNPIALASVVGTLAFLLGMSVGAYLSTRSFKWHAKRFLEESIDKGSTPGGAKEQHAIHTEGESRWRCFMNAHPYSYIPPSNALTPPEPVLNPAPLDVE
jgi:hypothetical protein